jgi:cell division protein FtsB
VAKYELLAQENTTLATKYDKLKAENKELKYEFEVLMKLSDLINEMDEIEET